MTDNDPRTHRGRRSFLASAAGLGTAALAGCTGVFDDGGDAEDGVWAGSAFRRDLVTGGTSWSEMPDLEGELTVYSGRGQFLVGELLSELNDEYDDFEATPRYGDSTDLVNQILTEGEATSADVFYSVNAGSLGVLADEGRTRQLSSEVAEMVGEEFRTDTWVGTSGRARSVPYNTDALSASALPDDVMAYPDLDADLGWAPGYGSCQAFVTAMRILEGEDATRQWLEEIQAAGITAYADEQLVCEAVADGEIDAGFANHYYIQRVQASRPDPPIATAFTEGDAGAIFNVAGATVIDQADDPELAANFVRHLLATEAQVYFATQTYEYPLVSGVEPVGDLPSIDELNVPEIDLTQLSDLEGTVDLMREAGVEV